MDSGFLAEGEPLEDTFNVLTELLPEEVVGLMDQMLCHEVSLAALPGATLISSNISDADPRFHRWRGIWVIHSQRHFSLRITLTVCSGLIPKG